MTDAWKQQVGQTIDGQFRLIQYLGGTEHSAVFLTEFGDKRQRFAIKLIGARPNGADAQLARLRRAAKLTHPHLARILQTGRGHIGSASILYVVTEYAAEDLAQVLPDRALRPEEVREMLPLIIDALQYLHSQGFVHARLKPSNILAVEDQLKLSSDGICAIGERGPAGEKPTPYDPPELAPNGPSTASDVWSLGMTIVEILTQRLPMWEWTGHADPPAPRTLPAPFLEIARNSLRRDPAIRCTLREISENIDPQPASVQPAATRSASRKPSQSISYELASAQPERIASANPPPQRSFSRYGIQAAAFVLALAAVIVVPRHFHHSSKSSETQSVAAFAPAENSAKANSSTSDAFKVEAAAQSASAPQPTPQPHPSDPEPPTMAASQSPSALKSASASEPNTNAKLDSAKPLAAVAQPRANPPVPTGATKSSVPAATSAALAPSAQPVNASAAVATRGKVAHQASPDVSKRALNTIHGKVRVSVKVNVDASGQVTSANFESAGPSKYFADAAMDAAKNWTFAPAKSGGDAIASTWLLRFEFSPSGPEVSSAQINP